MSQFTTPLKVDKIGEDLYKLKEAFEYHVGSYPSKEIITVPIGFITDYASMPKMFWDILPPNGPYAKAAVVHDYIYTTGIYSKFKSDLILLEAMKVLNVEPWQQNVIFIAVTLFGWVAWYKHRYLSTK